MEEFPCTDAEWNLIKDLAESILNAHYADDEALDASLHLEMLDHLAGLQERYGDHPVLLETMADYTEDAAERVALYRQAVEVAETHGLRTLSIRLALASALVHGLGDSWAALKVLDECGADAPDGFEGERTEWSSLLSSAAIEVDAAERVALFRRAMEVATAHGQSVLYLRLLLVRFWQDEEKPEAARAELRACEGSVPDADEDDRAFWAELCGELGLPRPECR